MSAQSPSEMPNRPMTQRLMRAIARRPRTFTQGLTIALIATFWVMLAAFVLREYDEISEESYTDLNGSQQTLATYFSTNYATARAILGTADEWVADHPETTEPAALNELGRFIGDRQRAAGQSELVLLVDEHGNERSIAAASDGKRATVDAELSGFGVSADTPASTTMMGLARYDPIACGDAIPVLQKARPNRLGIAYLETLIRIRPATEPFVNPHAEWPATFGLERPDRTIVFAWPQGRLRLGSRGHVVERENGSDDKEWTTVADFAGTGPALFSGVPLDGAADFSVFSTLDPSAIAARTKDRSVIPLAIVLVGSAMLLGLSTLISRLLKINEAETARTRRALTAAETASVAKTRFLANMSHELRTPLNAILGFSEVISGELFGPVGNARYVEYSHNVLHAGRHLLELIQNVLDMARIEAGHIKVGDTPTVFAEALAEVDELLANRMVGAGVSLNREIGPDCPRILIEPLHLKQLLINIIGNAVKFSRSGAVVTVATVKRPDGTLAIEIADTGIGIPSDKIADLFRPFSQAENGLARNHDGIGLGLTISKAIIDGYGGAIEIRSRLNAGTTVTLVFPKERLQATDASPARDVIVPLRSDAALSTGGAARAAKDGFSIAAKKLGQSGL